MPIRGPKELPRDKPLYFLVHLLPMVFFLSNSSLFNPNSKTYYILCSWFFIFSLLLDLRHLELEKEKEDSSSPREVLEAFMKDFVDSHHEQSHESETTSSTTKTHYHWTKFFKLWKKKSFKRLGSIPPLSVPKLPKWKSKSSRENQALSKLYNFRSSWVTFSLSELRNATNNFSDGLKSHPNYVIIWFKNSFFTLKFDMFD